MSGNAGALAPLPQAPTAHVPLGMTADGAARVAWRPNAFAWVSVWRLVVVIEGLVALGVDATPDASLRVLGFAGAYAVISALIGAIRPEGRARVPILVMDLAACIALLAVSADQPTFALMALYSYSTVVAWAAGRPVDAFVAAGAGAAAYLTLGLVGPYETTRPAGFVANLALYFFFALATSGFFTVVRRIGALEIATEIGKERGRYRRDLHDRLGQALCGLHFELQALHASGLAAGVEDRLRSLADGYRHAHTMLRDLFGGGDEPMVAANVASLMGQEARRLAQQTGARIDVNVSGDASRIPPWIRPHVCAIAGESTTNALKNGNARGIDIELDVADEIVVLSVTDDGTGFDNPPGTITEKEGHYGLREMAERARICNGEVVIASQPGFGTRVRLQVPLPDGGADDIIERDAAKLRENVWSLFTVLRAGLGLVALGQLAAGWGGATPRLAATALAVLMVVDLVLPTLRPGRAYARLAGSGRVATSYIGAYVVATSACLAFDVTPYFMLYAPLVLIAAALHGGRTLGTRATAGFVASLVVASLVVGQTTGLDDRQTQAVLLYVTNLLIIGMSAALGAQLLDRLETLQIRVRYQALARLRHGLSNRMRDQLIERLDELEGTARTLAERQLTPEEFAQATGRLEHGSSELKARLREIVHQLADPPPGRTATHV